MKFKGKVRQFRIYLDAIEYFNGYWLDKPLGKWLHLPVEDEER